MYKSKVKRNLLPDAKPRWDEAIYDAEKLIEEFQREIINLKRGIRAFKELRDSGAPFPGHSKEKGVTP